jgi:hypothetical protein
MLFSRVGLACSLLFACLIACEDDAEPSYVVGPGPGNGAAGNGAGGNPSLVLDGGIPACGDESGFVTLTFEGTTYNLVPVEVDYSVCFGSGTLRLVGCDSVQDACFSVQGPGPMSQIHRVHRENSGWVEDDTTLFTLILSDPVQCEGLTSLSTVPGADQGNLDAAVANVDAAVANLDAAVANLDAAVANVDAAVASTDAAVVDASASGAGGVDTSAVDASAADASAADASASPELILNLLVSQNTCLP